MTAFPPATVPDGTVPFRTLPVVPCRPGSVFWNVSAISRFRRRLVHNAAAHRFPENGAPHLRKAPFSHLSKRRSRRIPAHVRKRDAGASPATLRTFSGVTISPYCRHHGFMILMLNTQRGQVPSGRDVSCSLQVLRYRRSAYSGKKVRLQNTTAGPA